MKERTLEEMCVVCQHYNKQSCGYEERGIQHKCPYNDLIERGYGLAEKDLALTWEDVREIVQIAYHLCNELGWVQVMDEGQVAFYEEVLRRFNKKKEKAG